MRPAAPTASAEEPATSHNAPPPKKEGESSQGVESQGHAAEAPATAGEKADITKGEPSLALWTVVVFVGLLLVLRKFAWGPLLKALHEREAHLEHVLLDSEKARNEAEALAEKHRKELAKAADEVRALIEQARKEAQISADSILQKAQAEAEASRHRAEREIAGARDQALMEIWSKTADLAVSVAGKVLTKELGESDHRRLVEVAMSELPGQRAGRVALMTRDRSPVRPNVFEDVEPELTRNYAEALLNASGDQAEAVVEELEEIRRGRPRLSARASPQILVSSSVPAAEKDRIIDPDLRRPSLADGRHVPPGPEPPRPTRPLALGHRAGSGDDRPPTQTARRLRFARPSRSTRGSSRRSATAWPRCFKLRP